MQFCERQCTVVPVLQMSQHFGIDSCQSLNQHFTFVWRCIFNDLQASSMCPQSPLGTLPLFLLQVFLCCSCALK